MNELKDQGGLVIDDDLTPNRGTWVALRDGHIVASALDPIELRDRENVDSDDVLVLVPSQTVRL